MSEHTSLTCPGTCNNKLWTIAILNSHPLAVVQIG